MGSATGLTNQQRLQRALTQAIEPLEQRLMLSASFDITSLTAMRQQYPNITGAGIGIAVLDTGVDAQNPDLEPNVKAYFDAFSTSDPTAPADANPIADAQDLVGHGSHTSGIAASSNPTIGVAYQANLIDVRVLNGPSNENPTWDTVAVGLEWVADHAQQYNIKVVNMSLGEGGNYNSESDIGQFDQQAETQAIDNLQNMGITVVTSAGNDYASFATAGAQYPGCVSTICVSNIWADDGTASDLYDPSTGEGQYSWNGDDSTYAAYETSISPDTFNATSQRTTLPNELAAPGSDIYSTWNGTNSGTNSGDELHNVDTGTSMSAPFVAGTVALLQQAAQVYGGTYLTPAQVLSILQSTGNNLVDSNNPNNGRLPLQNGQAVNDPQNLPETGDTYKLVNVLAAVQKVQQTVSQGNPNPAPTSNAADTNSTTANATVLPDADGTQVISYTGNIGDDGAVQVGANDIDLYKINITSVGDLTIGLSLPAGGTSFDAALTVFDSSGNDIGQSTADDNGGAYPVLQTDPNSPLTEGTYYIGVSSVDNLNYNIADGSNATGGGSTGDYTLTVQLQNPDPNGTIQGAAQVNLTNANDVYQPYSGTPVYDFVEQGELGSDPPPTNSTTRITVSSDVDMFQVVAPDNGTFYAFTETTSVYGSSGADTYLEVFDANGNLLASNHYSNAGDPNVYSSLAINVSEGDTYYVAVTVPANAGFNPTDPYDRAADATPTNTDYDLHLYLDNGNTDGTVLSANSSNIGAEITGAITSAKYVDFYSFQASSNGLLGVGTEGLSGFTPTLSLWEYDSADNTVVQLGNSVGSNSSNVQYLFAPVQAGEYFYVSVTGQGNNGYNWATLASGSGGQTGSYGLVSVLDPLADESTLSNDSIQNNTPTPIALNQVLTGNIGNDGGLIVGADDIDMYKFVATTTGVINVTTNTNQDGDAATVLRFFDSHGNQIAENQNIADGTTDSQVTVSVVAGQTYYIGVTGVGPEALTYNPLTGAGAGPGSEGNYQLLVSPNTNTTSVAFSRAHPATFTSADNLPMRVQLTGAGAGELLFVNGSATPTEIELDGSSLASTLVFRGTGVLPAIQVNGSLNQLSAAQSLVAADIDITGALRSMAIRGQSGDSGATITVASPAVPVTLSLGDASTLNVNIAGAIKSLTARVSVPSSSGAIGSITAGSIGLLRSADDLATNLDIAGAVRSITVAGSILGGTWNVAGSATTISASAAINGDWAATFGGAVGTVSTRIFDGSLTAASVRTVKASQSDGLQLHAASFTQLLLGPTTDSAISADSSIGLLRATSLTDSVVTAGVATAPTSFPDSADIFSNLAASIRTVQISARAAAFSDSLIAAPHLTTVQIGSVASVNDAPFGVAAVTLGSFALNQPGDRFHWNSRQSPTLLSFPDEPNFYVELLS